MMMMMDAEEQFKTKWKRRWREAITGDPDRRIRDQMDDREVRKRVKLVDTASFTLGIVMVMTAEFLLVGYPRGFPWFYLILNTMLMMLRCIDINRQLEECRLQRVRKLAVNANVSG